MYTIETFAGSAWTGDGRPAREALLVQPQAVASDAAGNLYVSDAGDHRVRRIAPSGIIETVAGTGVAGYRGDGGPATRAMLRTPYGMAADAAGNLYIADLGNRCVRRVSADGTIRTYAGGGSQSISAGAAIKAVDVRLSQPRDVAVDRLGNLYISDFDAHYVYQVTPDGVLSVIAGTGQPGSLRVSKPAVEAPLANPAGLAVDPSGALYIADSGNQRVRRLQYAWLSTVVDSSGKAMEFSTPTGLACDPLGRLFVADGGARTTVLFPDGTFTALAIGGAAIALRNSSDLYTVSDRSVLRYVGATSEIFAGAMPGPGAGDGYNRSNWRFTGPSAMVRDQFGYLYIADTGNGRVRRISLNGELQTVTTRISAPVSLALDGQSRLHVGDKATGAVYRVDAAGNTEVVFQLENRPMNPVALAFDKQGHLFIADTENHLIRKLTPTGATTVVAGGGSQGGDGPALALRLLGPAGLQFDAQGDLWFTEAAGARVRRLSGGRVSTVFGPEWWEPRGVRMDTDGSMLIADAGQHRVIRLRSSGEWEAVAGSGDAGYSGDGEAALGGMLNWPVDVLPEKDGTVLVMDSGNHRIRRLHPMPPVETVKPPPAITMPPMDVLHAGTLKRAGVAPGQVVYIEGNGIPPQARITLDGLTAAVLSSSSTRVTALVPREIAPGVVEATVWSGDTAFAKAPVEIVPAAPAILTVDGRGGQALASNEDGATNGGSTPAGRGSVVTLFVTGEGNAPLPVTAEIGGYSAEVVWSGLAPGLPGVYQVNLRTPGGFSPSGVVPVVLTLGGVKTQPGVSLVSR